jgi:RND superfamily putative drug exporter
VILAWLALLFAAAPQAALLANRISNGGYTVPGSESARASELLRGHFPQDGQSSALVVIHSDAASAKTLLRAGHEVRQRLGRLAEVASTTETLLGPDDHDAFIAVGLRPELGQAQKQLPTLRRTLDSVGTNGAEIALGGQAPAFRAFSDTAVRDLRRAEQFTMPLTAGILLLAFLSAVAMGLPLLLAAVAMGVSFGCLSVLAAATDMSVFVSNTATLLGLALSIDYALFFVTRYREERRQQPAGTVEDAIARTIASAGRAIVVSGLAVSVSLASLSVIGVGIFNSMAAGAAATALIAAGAAITLAPATIMVLGRRLDRFMIRRAATAAARGTLWQRLASFVLANPLSTAAVTVLALGLLVVPAFSGRVGFPSPLSLPKGNEVRRASDLVAESFGRGALSPLRIVTKEPALRIADEVATDHEVVGVARTAAGTGGWHEVDVVLRHASGEPKAEAAVRRLRLSLAGEADGRTFVGGDTADGLDLADRVHDRFPLLVVAGVILSLMVLIPAYRSLAVPVKAAVSGLLSVGATLGILTLVFQGSGDGGALAYFVPPFLFAIVFGLALDYEVFLLSRIREEYVRGASNSEAIERGVVSSARAITLAALTMISVFLAFTFSSLTGFQQLGIGLSVAVFLDATVVRILLVPAALRLLGDRNWWWGARHARNERAAEAVSPASEAA